MKGTSTAIGRTGPISTPFYARSSDGIDEIDLHVIVITFQEYFATTALLGCQHDNCCEIAFVQKCQETLETMNDLLAGTFSFKVITAVAFHLSGCVPTVYCTSNIRK